MVPNAALAVREIETVVFGVVYAPFRDKIGIGDRECRTGDPSSDAIGTAVVVGVHAITDGMKEVLVDRLGLNLARTTRTPPSSIA